MPSSIEELLSMYRDCDYCGVAMCTEAAESVEFEGEHYCSKECKEAALRDES